MMTARFTLALLLLTATARAQTSYPMLMSLKPSATQTGQTSEHELESRYSMFGAYQVLVTGEGVSGEIATPMELDAEGNAPNLQKINIRFTVAADAQPGVRDFRIVGPTGASTLGQLVVVQDSIVSEEGENNQPDQALPISLPATVCGQIERAEDVDYYRFTLEEPATLNFHCRAMRLQDKMHDLQQHADPIITIKSAATGSTIASADNTYAADPFLSHTFAQPGEYLLQVRDVRYQGNRYWNYVIEINDRPFVSMVHPFGVAGSDPAELKLIGFHLPDESLVSYTPGEQIGPQDVRLPMGEALTNPVPVVHSDLPVIIETTEDNNARETAQPITAPGGISGRIETDSDIDCYSFEAKQGDSLSFEVVARRHWSGLDSIIRILNADGRQLSENDDLRLWGKRNYQDSLIENWKAPADGTYFLEIRDVHLRGGDDFVYFLKVQEATPDFELVLDSDKTWLSPGTSAAIFARVVRKNGFDGEVQLHVEGLPPGVTASCGRILAGKGEDGCIILEAEPGAEMAAANITIYGTATHVGPSVPDGRESGTDSPAWELRTTAQPMQETYMPGGGRNHWPVEMHTVAIGAPSDIRAVNLSTHDITLKPGESVTIDVEIERAEGFDNNVTLDLLFQHLSSKFAVTLPEGVTIDGGKSKTLLTGGETQGSITLVAAGNAPPVTQQQCAVMANVSINFVMKATYSSQPLLISVAAP